MAKKEKYNQRVRQNRSNSYQWLYAEKSFPHEMLDLFSNDDSIHKRLNPFTYNEEAEELMEQLRKEFWRLVKLLPPKQQKIVKLTAQGFTQIEIAKKLKINQSSVTKQLHSRPTDPNSKKGNIGIIYKIQLLATKDPDILEILKKLSELREDE